VALKGYSISFRRGHRRAAYGVQSKPIVDDDKASRVGYGEWGVFESVLDGRAAKSANVVVSGFPSHHRCAAGRRFDQQGKREGLWRNAPGHCVHPLKIEMRPRRRVVSAFIATIVNEDMKAWHSILRIKERSVS
jgi:hypothetical protein